MEFSANSHDWNYRFVYAPFGRPPLRPSFRKRGSVPPPGRDLFVVALILVIVDAIAAMFLISVYLPRRRREAMVGALAQLSLLARDRQNALPRWVRERMPDEELTASVRRAARSEATAAELLDRSTRAAGYAT